MQNSGMNFNDFGTSPVKILIVGDYPNIAALLAQSISRLDKTVEVISATSAYQALEYAQDGVPDILVTDMDMPGMTGLELIMKLSEHPSGSPTYSYLLATTYVSGLKIIARQLDVTEVLRKPIQPQKMVQTIIQALKEIDQFKLYKQIVAKKQFKILIADHDLDSVTLLSRYLEGDGYAYIVARDGKETLEQIYEASPDLVLLDAHIANGDGFTVLEEIHGDPSMQHVPVIILSASWISASEIHHRLNPDTDDFVSKPIDRTQLLTCIRKKLLVREV